MSNGNGTAVSIKPLIGKEMAVGIYGNGFTIMPYNPDNISLNTYIDMTTHPQVYSCLQLIKLPIQGVDWSLKCESEDIAKDMTERLKKIWIAFIRDLLTAIEFGFSGLEKRWKLDAKKKAEYQKFLALDPRYITIAMDGNSFAGFDYTGVSQTIPPEKCILFAPEQRFSNLYGRSRLKAAYDPWWTSKMITQFANRYMEQCGSPQKVVRHPEGQVKTGVDGSGNPVYTANSEIALSIGNSLQNLSVITMPCNPIRDGKEVEEWAIQLLGQEGAKNYGGDYIAYLDRLDSQIAKGMFIPDLLTGKSTETGNRAQNESYLDQFMTSEEGLLDLVKEVIDNYVLPQVVEYNYGSNAPPVTWEYVPLTDDTKETMKAIASEMVKGQTLRPDPEWMAEQLGIKLSEEKLEPPAQEPQKRQEEALKVISPSETKAEGFLGQIKGLFSGKKKAFEAEGLIFWRALSPAEQASGIDFESLATKMTAADIRIRGKMEEALISEAKKYIGRARKLIKAGVSWGDLLEKLEAIEMSIPEYRKMLRNEIRLLWDEARNIFARSYKVAKEEWPEEVAKAIEDKAEFISRTHTYKVKGEMLKASEEGWSAGLSGYAMEEKLKTAADQWIKTGPDLPATAQVTVTENINLAFMTQAELSTEFKALELSAILDSATCSYCRAVDGTTFDILDGKAENYRPPFHFNCRCLWIYIHKGDTGSSEPTKAPKLPQDTEDIRTFYPGEEYVPKWLQKELQGAKGVRKREAVAVYNAQVRAAGANRNLMDELRNKQKK